MTSDTRVVVLGAGAIGGITAASLARAGRDVTVIDPWYQHVAKVARDGMRVTTIDGEFTQRLDAIDIDRIAQVAPIRILLLALKSYDTEWAIRHATPYLAEDACVVSLQNGINEPTIASVVGRRRTVGCVVHLSGALEGPGHVLNTTRPSWSAFTVGDLEGSNGEREAMLAMQLSAVGPTAVSADIMSQLWAKLTLNVMTNALAGLTGFTTTQLWSDQDALEVMFHLGGELVEVADAIGQQVLPIRPSGSEGEIAAERLRAAHRGDPEAAAEVRAVMGAIAARRIGKSENRPSLLQDVIKRRRTEVDYLNGYIVEQARRAGVATPTNAAVVAAVRELGERDADPAPDNLGRLLAASR